MEIKLGELIINFDSKRKPLSKMVREKMKGPYPYYGAACIFDYVNDYIFDGEYILLGEDGTVLNSNGTPILQLTHGKFWPNNHTHVLKNSKLVDFKYLYYLLKNTVFTKIVTGAVQQKISQGQMNNLIVDYEPSIAVQRKIATVLSAIDAKIDLNKNIISNLEAQANAVFDEKLVKFDNIPSDWNVRSLDEIADYLNGLAMQKFEPQENEESLPVLKIAELKQGFCDVSSSRCTKNIKPEYYVYDGDVIFSWSASLVVDFWTGGTCGLNQHLFKVSSKKYDKWFYYGWTKYYLEEFIHEAAAKATTMGHIKRDRLTIAKALVPSKKEYDEIGNILAPMYEKQIELRLQNNRLIELRDALLPKLMSGEIDVEEVEI